MIRRLVFATAAWLAISADAMPADIAHSGLSKKDESCAQSTSMAIQQSLSTAGLIDPNKVDNHQTGITLLAKESLPHGETKQVFLLTLHEPTGRTVTVVTESKTGLIPGSKPAAYECPFDEVKGYVVSKEL